MRQIRFLFQVATLFFVSAVLQAAPLPKGKGKVEIKELPGKLRIEINGELFSEYVYENTSRPYLYPIIGAGGAKMTRNWPMKEEGDEERDHPHHKSWWYAHGEVNGIDFWAEGKESGKTVHEKFIEVKSGEVGVIKSANKLVAKDGSVVATDERTLKIYNVEGARLFDFEITTHASNGDLVFGDTKEGTMALRLNESMRLIRGKKKGEGHIVNSEGVRDGDTWGKRASWVDYYGPVEGKTVGVAMFDNPKNPRFPTWWHVRDYGLFAANPFGVHDFEKKEKGAGNLTVKAGDSITFKYRFYIHDGDEKQAKVLEQYEQYTAGK
ncbi:MAG TPA: PmoA family protein [Verrucomicrobiae bacterium]|nr:PmoA family protein [Verrucomicrobiae bacterium]